MTGLRKTDLFAVTYELYDLGVCSTSSVNFTMKPRTNVNQSSDPTEVDAQNKRCHHAKICQNYFGLRTRFFFLMGQYLNIWLESALSFKVRFESQISEVITEMGSKTQSNPAKTL